MKLEQLQLKDIDTGWEIVKSDLNSSDSIQLVFVFGHPEFIKIPERYYELKSLYPEAHIIGGSTAGNILGASISDNDIVATAIHLEKSKVRVVCADIDNSKDIQSVTSALMKELNGSDLQHVFVLSDGIHFNGSELARGLNVLDNVVVTGGLAGDQGKFEKTYIMANNPARSKSIVLVGFFGKNLHSEFGCYAGWGEFGRNRIITKAKGNVVYEIDNQPALTLYRKYLGEFAKDLPASGLRFPLSIRQENENHTLIRTLLAINEQDQSLTFAGTIPEGSVSVLMRGDIDDLIDGAGKAAEQACPSGKKRGLAVIISCVGRKLLMDQMIDEELETVQDICGQNIWMTGFYSNGEIAPVNKNIKGCRLHNQTMTLMTIYED